ncbi:MAG: lycopene cyclase domain-containing protein [Bacteroidota bacterium]|nr:lycopene cyclase domain-containing protein [Bacteroidota bacterium]MDO9613873.1 lycopene cyclase domain-containing protein [Bacteroidota bacterium]
MEFKNYTYLLLLIASIAVPLALSFDKNVQYYKNLKYILPAILVTAALFIVWDINFTKANVWSFNHEYTLGKDIKGLPIEEWLFFLVIPYACVFIYEVLKFYLKKQELANPFLAFSLFLMVGFALISYFFRHQAYTFLTFLFSAVYLGYTVFRNKFKPYITKFYYAYFVSLLPFLIVNGILTSMPVVEYNFAHILNIRIINIPIEDFSYLFLMLLMVTTIYENLKENKYY